jgi:EF-P beta-lysylation protein EpmB
MATMVRDRGMRDFPYKTTKHVREIIADTGSEAVSRQFDVDNREYETALRSDFNSDPVNDSAHRIGDGIIKKYKNRVLLITTGDCAVHCRYCFRRNFDYQYAIERHDFDPLIERIKTLDEVDEVILSGGDPLVLSNDALRRLIAGIGSCGNISRIRIHSRVLTVLPGRFDDALLSVFSESPKKIILVNHINHSDEISEKSTIAANKLLKLNVLLLNQSVLLKGVNDTAEILSDLSDKLFQAGILPYYLNLLDKVRSAEHYYLSHNEALRIYQSLSERVSGYLLPKLVYDDGGDSAKKIIGTHQG